MLNAYALRRVLQVIPQLFILTVISFAIISLAPGDPTSMMGGDTQIGFLLTVEQLEAMREHYGLDRPIHEQYYTWLKRVVRFDFGRSFADGRPITQRILDRLPATLLLTVTSMAISLTAIPLGVIAGYLRNTLFDHVITLQAFLGVALPGFWFAIIAIMVFGAWLEWLPVAGMTEPDEPTNVWTVLRHLILPAAVLGFGGNAALTRYARSSIIEVLLEDYVRTARAKGLRERLVLFRHAVRNAMLPVITILGLSLPALFTGAALVEQVFAWPGLGRAAVESTFTRDYPMVMALLIVVGTLTIFGNLLADLTYSVMDPRIRTGR
jgi:peptide/nickel transport system permease protein